MSDALAEIDLDADELIPEFQDVYSRIADRVNSGTILGDLPAWISKNTFLKGKPWSFKNHEFQIAIAKDQSNQKRVKKCSQVGLTELQIRLALAYLRVSNGRSLMYVLPFTKMAQRISQSRIEPVIEESPSLTSSLIAGANSALYKRIGNSHLYVGGADKPTEAISAPLDKLVIDERDFCRERVLGIYNSRMRHTEDGAEMRDEFSTPSISNFGISAGYNGSDQKRYLCKCAHCNQYQAVEFEDQIVIPGYSGLIKDLEKEDFTFHRYEFDKAYLRCIRCGKELDSSLGDPSRRQWVAKFPGRSISGYSVVPSDVPKYNATPRVILQMADYSSPQDYWNFVLGKELDTNDNKINNEIAKELFTGEMLGSGENMCVGIDVGKSVHIMVGKKINGLRCVVNIYKISFKTSDVFAEICNILDAFKFDLCTIDAQPDISLPNRLIEKYGEQRVHACYYVKGKKASSEIYELDEETGQVNAARTRGFDSMVKAVNKKGFEFPRVDDDMKKEVLEHFQQIARKEEYDAEGEKVAKWVKLSESDHYFHSLFYLHLSMEMFDGDYSAGDEALPLNIASVKIGSANSGKIQSAQAGDLATALGMMGFKTN